MAIDYKKLSRIVDGKSTGPTLEPLHIVSQEGNSIKVSCELFYSNIVYVDREDGQLCGDMGFVFEDQADTRNAESFETNVQGMVDWAEDERQYGEADEDAIPIYELCKGTFESEMTANDGESPEEAVEHNWAPYAATPVDGTEQVLYRVASCSREDGKHYNLNKVVGKIDRYI